MPVERLSREALELRNTIREANRRWREGWVRHVENRFRPRYVGTLYLNEDQTIKGYIISPDGSERIKVQFVERSGDLDEHREPMGMLINESTGEGVACEATTPRAWKTGWWWSGAQGSEFFSIRRRDRMNRGRRVFASIETRQTP